MNAPAKFLFDSDFGAGARPAEPTVTLAEHQAALAEAEMRGHRSGLVSAEANAKAEAEKRSAVALEKVGQGLDKLNAGLKAIEARLEAEAVEVAIAVARKLAPELVAREPLTEIAALAKRCFAEAISAPHVVVRVNDGLYASVRSPLEDVARAKGYEGRLVVLGEPDIKIGDCRIEWADGGLTRDSAVTEAAIMDAVTSYVGGRR